MVEKAAKELVDFGKSKGYDKELLRHKAYELSIEYNIPLNDILFCATAMMACEVIKKKSKGE